MSAKKWSECPRCRKAAEPAQVEEDTLREDYEIGVDLRGEFEVRYRCCCGKCGFEFKFRHDEQVTI